MGKLFKIFLILVLHVIVAGCISTPDLIKQDNFKPGKFSIDLLNGNYANADSSTRGLKMWSALYDCKSFKNDTTRNSTNAFINLNFDNKNKLTVTLKNKNMVLNKLELKVKQRGNYISVQRNLFLIPIPFIWTRYHEARVILSNDLNGNLHLNYARSQFIWTLMAGSVDQKFNEVYIKLTD